MNYLTRELICARLRLKQRQSYRIVPPSYGPLISSDEVLHLLNESRRGIAEPLEFIPSDLMTAEELSEDEALGGIVSPKKILLWTKRIKNVPPHFRINKHVTRFSRRSFFEWLDRGARRKKGGR